MELNVRLLPAWLSGLMSLLTSAPVFPADAVITMLYPNMAPYIRSVPGSDMPQGPVAERVAQIARSAGLTIDWRGPVPRARILAEMGQGEPVCTPNALATAERRQVFKFSEPIFYAPEWVAVVRADARWIDSYSTLADLLGDRHRSFGHLAGASFGPPADQLIALHGINKQSFRGTPGELLRVLAAGRVDYILIDAGDLENQALAMGMDHNMLRLVRFPDMATEGGGRIMCSQAVDSNLIDRLNRAIAATSGEIAQGPVAHP